MGSYRNYFLLPGTTKPIITSNLLTELTQEGWQLEFDAFIVELGSDGAIASSRDVHLSEEHPLQIESSLDENERVLCTFAHEHLPLNMNFAAPSNPNVLTLSHSNKLWKRLSAEEHNHTENILARIATNSAAELVLTINDPPDDVLGRILRLGDQWLIDLNTQGMELDPCVLWAKDLSTAPVMRNLKPTRERRSAYEVYIESP
jgi:hypothetical protein